MLSWIVFWRVGFGHETAHVAIERWITSGELDIAGRSRIDTLTAVMLVVVTTVSALVHVYSIGYMHEDDSRPRFFAYLSLLHLRHADAGDGRQPPADVLRLGGRGPRLLSADRLLVQKPEANAAAIKAFVVNRVGDFGFALGIFGMFAVFGTVDFDADVPTPRRAWPASTSSSSATSRTS